MTGLGNVPGDLQNLILALDRLVNLFWPFLHPNEVVRSLADGSLGLLQMWFGFVLSTTDVESRGDFINDATIKSFEPIVQLVGNGLLAPAAVWASYRIMWGHGGVNSHYTARILLPRLVMGAVLVNFAMPLLQAAITVSNTLCQVIEQFQTIPSWDQLRTAFILNPGDGLWEVITTGLLVLGYDVLAIAYLVRYTILIVTAITAPLAAALFVLPDTQQLAKLWRKLFVTNLFMQPIQLFVLAIGFALDQAGGLPVRHLFALATLLVVFKVPGAMGSADKVAHKLESTFHTAATHLERAVVRAV